MMMTQLNANSESVLNQRDVRTNLISNKFQFENNFMLAFTLPEQKDEQ